MRMLGVYKLGLFSKIPEKIFVADEVKPWK